MKLFPIATFDNRFGAELEGGRIARDDVTGDEIAARAMAVAGRGVVADTERRKASARRDRVVGDAVSRTASAADEDTEASAVDRIVGHHYF